MQGDVLVNEIVDSLSGIAADGHRDSSFAKGVGPLAGL